jgi:hypothetical protein
MREGEGQYFNVAMETVQILPCLPRHYHGNDFGADPERSLILARQFIYAQSNKTVRPENILKRLVLHQHPKTVCVIIVHMQGHGGKDDQEAWRAQINRQISIIKEAKRLELDIFQTWRTTGQTVKSAIPTVPRLRKLIDTYSSSMIFGGPKGNALEGKEIERGNVKNFKLSHMLRIRNVGAAVVMGQEVHACVKDTIFGKIYDTIYSPGLLDLGISVVTSRDILAPSEDGTLRSSLYEFEMETELVEALSPSPALQRSALAAATYALTGAADNAST